MREESTVLTGLKKTVKLPFPLTIKFKSMLQAGVQTKDMDPRWMSSISWYFLCIFGLQFVYVFLLGSDNGMFCGLQNLELKLAN